jgi:hypothetical protein
MEPPNRLAEPPTPYQDLNRVLRSLVDGVRDVFGEQFVGAYLQGSFAVGDFDLHSDVDLILVVQAVPTKSQVEGLQRNHDRVMAAPSRWATHLEYSTFPLAVLQAPPRPGDLLWYFDNGAPRLIQSEHCNTLLVRAVVREQGITLAGPPPATLLAPVDPEDLRQEIHGTMTRWGEQVLADPGLIDNRFYQAFAVLSFGRMLHDLHTGRPGSKLAGAEWIIYNRLAEDFNGLIERSWNRRLNPANWIGLPADPDELQATLAFIRHVLELARRSVADEAGS